MTSKNSGFELSGAGDDGTDDSVEAGVSSNIRRGIGRRICSDMLDVEETGVDCRGRIGCTKRCSRLPSCSLSKNWPRLVPHLEKERSLYSLKSKDARSRVRTEGRVCKAAIGGGLEFAIVLGFVSTQLASKE